MPNIVNRERGGVVFEKAERGLPTITPSTDSNETDAGIIFTIQARTHELGDTTGRASRRTAYRYYFATSDSDMDLATNTTITAASSGATGIAITTTAVIPDSTVAQFHHGTVITNSTGGAVMRIASTTGILLSLVLITPDGLLAASTEHGSSST
jgi:hypothetical protein